MSRKPDIDSGCIARARKALVSARSAEERREAQAVLLPGVLGLSLEKTGELLGVGRASVHRLQIRFRANTARPKAARNWGGRRNALMGMEEEKEFLEPWVKQAQTGGVVVVSPLRAALAQRLGRAVKPSVIYRLLARHGWRKVAPDTRHPKSDPAVQQEWGKNFRRHWRRC
jgi:transposase